MIALENFRLPDTTVNGITVELTVNVYHDDVSFDGDDEQDQSDYARGAFSMVLIKVSASALGSTGEDLLAGVAYSRREDIHTAIADYGMIAEAIADLKQTAAAQLAHMDAIKTLIGEV